MLPLQHGGHRSPRSQTYLLHAAFSELAWWHRKDIGSYVMCLYNRPQYFLKVTKKLIKFTFVRVLFQRCSLITVCVQLWIPPDPPQSEVCLGWWRAPPWMVHRNPPRSASASAPWPPEATMTDHSRIMMSPLTWWCVCLLLTDFSNVAKNLM